MRDESAIVYGRYPVLEALRSGQTADRLFVQEGLKEGAVFTILQIAGKLGIRVDFIKKERLDELSRGERHQGVLMYLAAARYYEPSDMLRLAAERGEDAFLFLLDGIEDPHNLGAIIRTANVCGAHGVIIPKRRASGLTTVAAKASAGAVSHTMVARVSNICDTIEKLKKEGMWFVCADMNGKSMYELDLKGPIGLVIGNEGSGVSRLVRENCDFAASIPMKGQISSLNASVACGILAYEIFRQRMEK